ncbi:MAG: hypothetical protein HYZ15_13020 [Sphingobacteriales bacterium]|nr:hypothetical protein [Sphingobacteriales bacterium]
MSRFIDAVIDGDLHALTISGEPTNEQLLEALENLIGQYNDAMGADNPQTQRKIGLLRSVSMNEAKLAALAELIDLMRQYYVPQFAQAINRGTGANFKFDVSKPDEYEKELDRAAMRLRALKMRAKLESEKLTALMTEEEKAGDESTANRAFFSRVLINLSDHSKTNLTTDTLTVYEFTERVHRYNKQLNNPKTL